MEVCEIVLVLSMSDGQSIVSPVAGYLGQEKAIQVLTLLTDDLKKKVSEDKKKEDSLLAALGIEEVSTGLRSIHVEDSLRSLGGILLPGQG